MFSKFGCIVHIGQSHQASECSMNESQRTLSEGSDLSAFADCYLLSDARIFVMLLLSYVTPHVAPES